jgi:hypothetical protein
MQIQRTAAKTHFTNTSAIIAAQIGRGFFYILIQHSIVDDSFLQIKNAKVINLLGALPYQEPILDCWLGAGNRKSSFLLPRVRIEFVTFCTDCHWKFVQDFRELPL